jgi:hypothetical protein
MAKTKVYKHERVELETGYEGRMTELGKQGYRVVGTLSDRDGTYAVLLECVTYVKEEIDDYEDDWQARSW